MFDPVAIGVLVGVEALALAVGEANEALPGAFFANFPTSHDLYLGGNITPLLAETDLALLVESRSPWYPPSNAPKNATIVALGKNPLKAHMVYQVMEAGHYLEGDVAITLELLVQALRKLDYDTTMVAKRRARWLAEHVKWRERLIAAERKAADAASITVPLVAKTLRGRMPADTIYVDETIVHRVMLNFRGNYRAPCIAQRMRHARARGFAFFSRNFFMTTVQRKSA